MLKITTTMMDNDDDNNVDGDGDDADADAMISMISLIKILE